MLNLQTEVICLFKPIIEGDDNVQKILSELLIKFHILYKDFYAFIRPPYKVVNTL